MNIYQRIVLILGAISLFLIIIYFPYVTGYSRAYIKIFFVVGITTLLFFALKVIGERKKKI